MLLAAFFVAQGCSQLVVGRYLLPAQDEDASAAPRLGSAPPFGGLAGLNRRDPMAILRRNIFDSQTGPLDRVQSSGAGEDGAPGAPQGACSANLKLVAALVSYQDPTRSIAAIANGDQAMPYQVGMQVDGRELLAVHPEAAMLGQGGQVCTLSLFADDGSASPAPGSAAAPKPVRPTPARPAIAGGISDADYQAGITKLSETRYKITRGLMDKILGNRAALLQTARIRPHDVGGRVDGVQLARIRPGSVLSRIGLRVGDVLRTINGYDMASPDKALEAYARLRTADRLALSVLRNGQPMNFNYDIR
ncbi:MAG: type II secretion system protein GspC [Polyangiales bacterium]